MNDFDLERLAHVWQEEPPQAELESMRKNALRARRRGRAAQWIDTVVAVAVAAFVIFLVWISGTRGTAVAGAGAIAVLLLTQRRQRRLRAIELQSLNGSTEGLLDQSIARARAALKRHWLSIIGMGPATLLGWLLGFYAEGPGARHALPRQMNDPFFRWAIFILLAMIFLYLLAEIRKVRAELERLQSLRASYRDEKEEGAPDSPSS